MAGLVTALVLLPTPESKLEMKWQGPYTVTRALEYGVRLASSIELIILTC